MAGGAVARKHVAAHAPQCPEGHDDALRHDINRGQLAGSEEGLTMRALAEEKDR